MVERQRIQRRAVAILAIAAVVVLTVAAMLAVLAFASLTGPGFLRGAGTGQRNANPPAVLATESPLVSPGIPDTLDRPGAWLDGAG